MCYSWADPVPLPFHISMESRCTTSRVRLEETPSSRRKGGNTLPPFPRSSSTTLEMLLSPCVLSFLLLACFALAIRRIMLTIYSLHVWFEQVWTSTLRRTIQTAQHLPYPKKTWKSLDELDGGVCDGMTYEEIEERYPEDYESRDEVRSFPPFSTLFASSDARADIFTCASCPVPSRRTSTTIDTEVESHIETSLSDSSPSSWSSNVKRTSSSLAIRLSSVVCS
jgi:hypothetical protein